MTAVDLAPPRRLTGRAVLAMLIGFFATITAVNGLMIHYAVSTFPGVDDKAAYEHGLSFDRDIAAAQAQDARHWHVDARVTRRPGGMADVIVDIRDATDVAMVDLQVSGRLEFLPDRKRDRALDFAMTSPGDYRAAVAAPAGTWLLEIIATQHGDTVYRSRNRVRLD